MNSINWIKTLVIILVWSMSGCVSLNSVKSPDFNKNVNRIFFYMNGAKGSDNFYLQFITATKEILVNHNITTEYYIVNPLALESLKMINDKSKSINPDIIISINQTENYFNSGNNTAATFDIKIFDNGSDVPIWRGNMEVTGFLNYKDATNKSVKRFIERLIEDKIIK